jgi:hypothetical protein
MQGSVSAAGVQVSEANATDLLFSKGIANGQLNSFMQNVIVPDMKNRTGAINGQRDALVSQLRHELDLEPSPNGRLTPPSGGLITVQLKDGRTGQIHPSQLTDFLKANPGAKQVGGK